jgi:hypothetical protein
MRHNELFAKSQLPDSMESKRERTRIEPRTLFDFAKG